MISRTDLAARLAVAGFMAHTKLRYPKVDMGKVKISGAMRAAMTKAVLAELEKITKENPPTLLPLMFDPSAPLDMRPRPLHPMARAGTMDNNGNIYTAGDAAYADVMANDPFGDRADFAEVGRSDAVDKRWPYEDAK